MGGCGDVGRGDERKRRKGAGKLQGRREEEEKDEKHEYSKGQRELPGQ